MHMKARMADAGPDPCVCVRGLRPDELLKGLYAMGFQRPSKIQESALPLLLRNGPDGRYVRTDPCDA
jgi:superfamily II DNA/RNA helicase